MLVKPTSISHPVSGKQPAFFFLPTHIATLTHLVRLKPKQIIIFQPSPWDAKPPQHKSTFSLFVSFLPSLPFRLVTLHSRVVREHFIINQMSKFSTWWCHINLKVKIERNNLSFLFRSHNNIQKTLNLDLTMSKMKYLTPTTKNEADGVLIKRKKMQCQNRIQNQHGITLHLLPPKNLRRQWLKEKKKKKLQSQHEVTDTRWQKDGGQANEH